MTLRFVVGSFVGCAVLYACGFVVGKIFPSLSELTMFWAGMAYMALLAKL